MYLIYDNKGVMVGSFNPVEWDCDFLTYFAHYYGDSFKWVKVSLRIPCPQGRANLGDVYHVTVVDVSE